jgi:hypothetical protein
MSSLRRTCGRGVPMHVGASSLDEHMKRSSTKARKNVPLLTPHNANVSSSKAMLLASRSHLLSSHEFDATIIRQTETCVKMTGSPSSVLLLESSDEKARAGTNGKLHIQIESPWFKIRRGTIWCNDSMLLYSIIDFEHKPSRAVVVSLTVK